jgi:hypothetical protein
MGTIRPNCDRHDAIRRIAGPRAHLPPKQVDAADLYFKQTTAIGRLSATTAVATANEHASLCWTSHWDRSIVEIRF